MRTLFGIMLLALTGCLDQQDRVDYAAEHEPYCVRDAYREWHDVDGPPRVDRTPVVLEDPAEIAKLRKRYRDQLMESYAEAMEIMETDPWSYWGYMETFEQMSGRAKADLTRRMNDTGKSAESRIASADALAELGYTSGLDFLFACLKSPNAELRQQAADAFGGLTKKPDFTIGDRATLVLKLLEDPDVEISDMAASVCCQATVPGAEERMVEVLKAAGENKRPYLARALAEIATRPESVEVLLPHVMQEAGETYDAGEISSFYRLIHHEDPAMSGPIRRAVFEYLREFPDERYNEYLVADLVACAGPEDKEVLLDIRANAPESWARLSATEALARLEPEHAVELLLEYAEENDELNMVTPQLWKYAKPEDFPRLKKQLLALEGPWDVDVVELCFDKLGDQGKELLKAHQDRLVDDAQGVWNWRRQGLDLRDALSEFHAAGILVSTPDEVLSTMRKLRYMEEWEEEIDLGNPYELQSALEADKVLLSINAAVGTPPHRHDLVLKSLAEISRGTIDPQCLHELWLRMYEDDEDAPYLIQFLAGRQLFQVGAENYGEWYDLEAVVGLANFYLQESGRKERFHSIDTVGQVASLVFADLEKLRPLAEKYGLTLNLNVRQAMDNGRRIAETYP